MNVVLLGVASGSLFVVLLIVMARRCFFATDSDSAPDGTAPRRKQRRAAETLSMLRKPPQASRRELDCEKQWLRMDDDDGMGEEDDGVGGDDDGVGDEEFKDKLGIHDVKETLEAPGAACSCTINRQSALAGPRSSRSKEVDQALADVYESYRNLKKTNGS